MTAEPSDTLTNSLTDLAAELATVQERINHLQARESALKAGIRELVDGPDTYAAGNLTVVVSTNRRFNAARALQLLPDPLRPLVITTVEQVDRDKLRALAPDLYEQCQDHGDYRVALR